MPLHSKGKPEGSHLPLAFLFCSSGVAAQVIWLCNFPDWEKRNKNSRHRIVLTELGEVSKHIQRSMTNRYLTRTAVPALRTLGYYYMRQRAPEPKAMKSRCYLWPRCIDRKVRQVCGSCSDKMCGGHSTQNLLCDYCLDE